MFLSKLLYIVNESIVREITFKKGMNFIVDHTTDNSNMTGNGVGKTTVLKVIDIAFGAEIEILYKDSMGEIEEVKNFISSNEVKFELLVEKASREYALTVILKSSKNKLKSFYFIDGKSFANRIQYSEELKNIFFPNLMGIKIPTFRQLMSRHNRYKDFNIEEPLKTLLVGRNDDYEALNLVMLGITPPDIDKIKSLKKNLELYKKILKETLGSRSVTAVKEALFLTKSSIKEYEHWENLLNENKNLLVDIGNLNNIKSKINIISNALTSQKFSLEACQRSVDSVLKTKSNLNLREMELIYETAGVYNQDLHDSFEKFIETHNFIVEDKVNFLRIRENNLKDEIELLESDLQKLLIQESDLISKIEKLDTIENIKREISNINTLNYQKAQLEEKLNNINLYDTKIKFIQNELVEYNTELDNVKNFTSINEKVREINYYFQDFLNKVFSKNLCKTSFILANEEAANTKDGSSIKEFLKFEFIDQNNSSGFKQNSVMFFDVARMLFQQKNQIDFIGFVLNDKKEIVYSAQINEAIKYLKDKDVQVIVSILKESITNLNVEDSIILELSSNDKFLRIGNI